MQVFEDGNIGALRTKRETEISKSLRMQKSFDDHWTNNLTLPMQIAAIIPGNSMLVHFWILRLKILKQNVWFCSSK